MDLELQDRVIIVTGAGRGLGAAAAERLYQEGARLLLVSRTESELERVRRRLSGDPSRVDVLPIDLTQTDAPEQVVAMALRRYGRVDGLVNSAGGSRGGVFWEIPDRHWREAFELKFFGTLRMIRAALPPMREQRYGRIVIIAGNLGLQPDKRMLPGSSVNAALMAAAKGLAQEIAADQVVINTVNPGPTRTERWTHLMRDLAAARGTEVATVEQEVMADIPMQRLAEPEEIASHIAFLMSDAAAHLTGSTLNPDGGWTRG